MTSMPAVSCSATANGTARSQARSQLARERRPETYSRMRSSSHAGRGRLPMTAVGNNGSLARYELMMGHLSEKQTRDCPVLFNSNVFHLMRGDAMVRRISVW